MIERNAPSYVIVGRNIKLWWVKRKWTARTNEFLFIHLKNFVQYLLKM